MQNMKWINDIKEIIKDNIDDDNLDNQISQINELRRIIHNFSPFKNEPVDCVVWEKSDKVVANDYNPNRVAPPEMELLEISIVNDGYTQPIVTFPNGDNIEVVDGFHRNRVGKESKVVAERIKGYLPVVIIRKEQTSKNNRIASTIRHNRARGKHIVDAMSEIVLELKNRNWTNSRISKELGMDEDEILRLCQITGLEDLFKDEDFSKSWMIEDSDIEFEPLTDEITEDEKELHGWRTINTDDEDRVFHTYDKWECYKAGFYNTSMNGMSQEECEQKYYDVLTDEKLFSETLEKIITEWVNSCEHYLTNKGMNRLAWLGQAAVCYATGVPSKYSPGWNLLSKHQKNKANEIALKYLNKYLSKHKKEEVDLFTAMTDKQVNIY